MTHQPNELRRRARLEAILESLSAAVLIEDATRRVEHVNRRFCQLFADGAPPEQLLGSDCVAAAQAAAVLFQDPTGFVEGIERARVAQDVIRGERLCMRDGRVLERDYVAVPDGPGAVAHVWIYEDVTERERALRELEDKKAEVQAILESALDAIITIDTSGTIRSVNSAVYELFDYRPEEVLGENVTVLMAEPHRSAHAGYLASYLETGEKKVIGRGRESIGRRKDGSLFPIGLTVAELRLGDELLFTGVIRDITARKETEARLQESLEELHHSRDNMLAVLNQLRVGTIALRDDQSIAFVSDCCAALAGLSPEQATGRTWTEILPLDRPAREALRRAFRTPAPDRQRVATRCKAASGEQRWLEIDVRDDPADGSRKLAYFYDVSELHELRAEAHRNQHGSMVGDSQPMRTVYRQIDQVARGDWTVLIEGETGVGKELVASAIHAASSRCDAPFVAVNCAGLGDSLLASQLFGHRKGAFTGAISDQEGLFQAADGGTLFLDEIGDISPTMQTMLLRAIQEREVLRVGDVRPRAVDTRIIVATNRDLAEMVQQGRYRADLFYRIRVARIRVPPLRERRDDIPSLVKAFLSEQRVSVGRSIDEIEPAAMRRLVDHGWPGNVRELRSAVEFAVISCPSHRLRLEDLPPELVDATPIAEPGEQTEGERILAALRETGGNRTRAARILGISRATFYRKLAALRAEESV